MTVFDDLISIANPTVLERHIHRQAGASWEIRQYLEVGTPSTPMDWAGCTASCQIRTRGNDLIYTFTSLTFPSAGWLYITATPTQTAAIAPGDYIYDVDIVNSTNRRLPFMAGSFRVGKQVTV